MTERAYSPPRVVRLDVESLTRAHVALGTLERKLRDDGRRLAAMREALEGRMLRLDRASRRLDVESLTRAHVALGTLERELRDDGRRLAAMREALERLERQAKPPG